MGVNKRLTIYSRDGADVTIVNAPDSNDHVFEVTADWVNISGFKVTGATGYDKAGICLSRDHCNISDNTASNNNIGISLFLSSDNNTLTNNTLTNNYNDGIYLSASNNNMITDNTVSNNRIGINMWHSINNIIANNTVSGNTQWDIGISYSSTGGTNTFTNNTLASYPTTVSFTYSGTVVLLKGVSSPPYNPGGYYNIGKYIEAEASNPSWLFLNFSYSEADVSSAGINERTLKIWKYNGTTWHEDGWNGNRFLDMDNNIVGVNITNVSISIFAPLGRSGDTTPPVEVPTITPLSFLLALLSLLGLGAVVMRGLYME